MRCSHYFQSAEADLKSNNIKRHTIYSLSSVIDAIFYELKEMDKLHLKANKVRILKDFLVHFPYMLDKKFTCDIIIQGFIDVGMLDAKHKLWPDFYAILKTKRRSITISEIKLLRNIFLNCSKSCWKRVTYLRKFMMLLDFQKTG